MINLLEAKRAGLFTRERLLPNIVAGIIVGVVALPLAMAFAIASGVRPERGLYTAIVAGFLVAAFGGSRVQIAGPTGAFIAILSGITAKHGVDGLQIATLMAGAMLLVMGMAKLGSVIKFIPAPVIAGFTAGIGVIIWVGQWQYFFGLQGVTGTHFHDKLLHALEALPHLHPVTTMFGLGSLLIVLFANRLPYMQRVPGPLVAMVCATAAQAIWHFDGVATIGSAFGGIPQHLPSFALPAVSAARLVELVGPAFTIAMLGAIESLLSAVVADGMAGTRHDSNQELMGQGIANLAAPLFGGFAATGAIARTATSIRNGGTSPLAGITHSVTLVLVIVMLAPLAVDVPLAALAAILFVVSYNMSELPHVIRMVRRAPQADVAILLITFALTVFVDLVVAVNIGVILAMLQFMRRMSVSVEVQRAEGGDVSEEMGAELQRQGWKGRALPPGVLVYTIDGPFFFGAVENFESTLAQSHTDPDVLVLRLKRVPFVDMTALLTLEEVVEAMRKRNVRVILCEANELVKGKLDKAGLLELVGARNYADTLVLALSSCRQGPRAVAPGDVDRRGKRRQRLATSHFLEASRKYLLGDKER
ncbi:MAG: STAS domain-containing protein [Burkholderiaceae bacterium]|nr:STAS domain-containing protein [Burkholderiaceae bacterium]